MVSFPPLIDMLKFSGYPYLIRGQKDGLSGLAPPGLQSEDFTALEARRDRRCLSGPHGAGPNVKLRLRVLMTLEQACPPECQGAQCAFKDSMIH